MARGRKKEVPASDRTATADHNAAKPAAMTDEQAQALFFNHKKTYAKALDEKKQTDAKFKNVCKVIKAEGSKLDDILLAIALESDEGDATLKAKIEAQLRVARWMGSAVGTQFDMFEDRTPSVDKAFEDGKRAGLRGDDAKPPHAAASEQGQKWMHGWHNGQAILAKGFKKPMDEGFDKQGRVFSEDFVDADMGVGD